jgi:hypothetical protein
MALQAYQQHGVRGVRIVPIGLLFERKESPRSRVLLQVGEPIDVDVLVVGAGPAGLTAATYLGRFRRSVLVADGGPPRACWIPVSHNMAGFPKGITGDAILTRMREQALEYGAVIEAGRVEAVHRDGEDFVATLNRRQVRARAVLLATGVPYPTYFAGAQFIHFLLGPAVVALAWPLWQRRSELRQRWGRLLLAALAGGAATAGSAVALGWAVGLPVDVLLSLAPKSVTAPVAMGIAEKIGGIPALAAVFAVMAGLIGALAGKYLFDLCRIPLDAAEAARVIVAGQTIAVDVGEVNGRVFLNNSSVGLYPRIVQLRERYRARGLEKWIVAAWATLRVTRKSKPLRVQLDIDDRRVSRSTPLVFIGNNEYRMAGFDAGSRASLTAGHLAIYIVATNGQLGFLRLTWRILTGTAQGSGELAVLRATEVTIDLPDEPAVTQLPVALDGELETMQLPLTYTIRPGALRVAVPR